MTVKKIISRTEAVRLLGSENLYDADDWIVDPEEGGTMLHLHCCLAPSILDFCTFRAVMRQP